MLALNKKVILLTMLAMLGLTLVSGLNYFWPALGNISFWCIALIITAISLKNLKWGLFLALGELFYGSVGRLLAWPAGTDHSLLSGRIIIWLVILLVWFLYLVFSKNYRSLAKTKIMAVWQNYGWWLVAFLAVIVWGMARGWLSGLDSQAIIADANGWWYFALLGPLVTTLDRTDRQTVFNILIGSTLATAVLTLGLFVAFSLDQNLAATFYPWLRDLRTGEATFINHSFWRIFLPSQFYVAISLLISWSMFVDYYRGGWHKTAYVWLMIFSLTTLVVYLSLSRTFWLALGCGLLIMAGYYVGSKKINYRQFFKFGLLAITIAVTEVILVGWFVGFGVGPDLNARLTDLAEPAASSRLHQLPPLYEKIAARPLGGWGFGQTITYQSFDPLILNLYPDGLYTTFTSEWGYLDMLMKFGILGVLIYGWGLVCLTKTLWRGDDLDRLIFISLIFVIICHIFSPYLNHPLGLGYLALLLTLAPWPQRSVTA